MFGHFLRCLVLLALFPAGATAGWEVDLKWGVTGAAHSDSSPAVADDGTIYFGTWDGDLWALDPKGYHKWTFKSGAEIKSSPAVATDSTVYFGSRNRKLFAVTPDGAEKWTFKTGGWIDSSPALGRDGTIYFGSWDKKFYAVKPDGTLLWKFPTGGVIVSSPAIGLDGTIYFGSHDNKFYALSPAGSKLWSYSTGGPILSSPALNHDDCLYFSSADGYLHAVTLQGQRRWELHTAGITEGSPVIGTNGNIFINVNDRLWAITPDGKKKWDRRGNDVPINSTPLVLADGTLVFRSPWTMVAFFPEDPILLMKWTFYVVGTGWASPNIGTTGLLYSSSNRKGNEFCAIPVNTTLAATPWPKFRANPRNTGNLQDQPK